VSVPAAAVSVAAGAQKGPGSQAAAKPAAWTASSDVKMTSARAAGTTTLSGVCARARRSERPRGQRVRPRARGRGARLRLRAAERAQHLVAAVVVHGDDRDGVEPGLGGEAAEVEPHVRVAGREQPGARAARAVLPAPRRAVREAAGRGGQRREAGAQRRGRRRRRRRRRRRAAVALQLVPGRAAGGRAGHGRPQRGVAGGAGRAVGAGAGAGRERAQQRLAGQQRPDRQAARRRAQRRGADRQREQRGAARQRAGQLQRRRRARLRARQGAVCAVHSGAAGRARSAPPCLHLQAGQVDGAGRAGRCA